MSRMNLCKAQAIIHEEREDDSDFSHYADDDHHHDNELTLWHEENARWAEVDRSVWSGNDVSEGRARAQRLAFHLRGDDDPSDFDCEIDERTHPDSWYDDMPM